jgi:poly(A) polymerase
MDDGVTDSAVRRLMFETGNEIDNLMLLYLADNNSRNQKLVEKVKQNYDLIILRKMEEKVRIWNWQPPL